jgi:hypothetical protein
MTVLGNEPTRRCAVKRAGIIAVLSIAMALFASGCMWGIVTDAETGEPVGNIRVRWYDSFDRWGETATGPNGLYRFDVGQGDEVPMPGQVTFELGGPVVGGCRAPLQERLVLYDDGPASDVWETQNFAAECPSDVEPPDIERPNLSPEPTSTPAPSATSTPAPSPTSTPAPLFRFWLLPIATPVPPPR